jgi:hypothetical protein
MARGANDSALHALYLNGYGVRCGVVAVVAWCSYCMLLLLRVIQSRSLRHQFDLPLTLSFD